MTSDFYSYGNEGLLDLLERWLNETPTQAEVEAERKSLAQIMVALSQPHGPNEPQLLKAIEDAVNTFAYIANHGGDPYGSKEHMRVEDYDVLRQVAEAAGEKCEELNALHKRISATNDRQEKA